MGCGGAGGRAPHTPKYLEKFGFACNRHNRAHFCETVKTKGSNPMFRRQLHILLNILIKLVLLATFTTGLIFTVRNEVAAR